MSSSGQILTVAAPSDLIRMYASSSPSGNAMSDGKFVTRRIPSVRRYGYPALSNPCGLLMPLLSYNWPLSLRVRVGACPVLDTGVRMNPLPRDLQIHIPSPLRERARVRVKPLSPLIHKRRNLLELALHYRLGVHFQPLLQRRGVDAAEVYRVLQVFAVLPVRRV